MVDLLMTRGRTDKVQMKRKATTTLLPNLIYHYKTITVQSQIGKESVQKKKT